mmetsp:Transcript_22206/g.33043  ORF Transcript_22206/g.33043 Transcript_22206/m.33043 type:complete len:88 (+) Transcript_22206:512-775(+)
MEFRPGYLLTFNSTPTGRTLSPLVSSLPNADQLPPEERQEHMFSIWGVPLEDPPKGKAKQNWTGAEDVDKFLEAVQNRVDTEIAETK